MEAPTVILLAGGESVRFWPLSHKNCTSFLGKTLLFWHYDQLVRLGFKRVIVVTNADTTAMIKHVDPPGNLTVTYAVQKDKGQGQAVLAAANVMKKGPACVINASDVYDDTLFRLLLGKFRENERSFYIGAVSLPSYFPGGYLVFNADRSVKEIIEKPAPGTQPGSTVRIVCDLFPDISGIIPFLRRHIKQEGSAYELAINAYIRKGNTGKAVLSQGPWLALKYPWHLLSLMDASLAGIKRTNISSSARIAKFVTIEGPVIIGDHVRIFENTKIIGPTYIGNDTIIGNNTMIRRSHIGSSVVTGFNTDITRSYIGDNTWFHSNYIGDSIVGSNVSMGSGTVLANLRLDESSIWSKVKEERIDTGRNKLGAIIGDDVRIGVNASIMPGVKIGKDSFVGAGVVLSEDLPDGSYVQVSPSVVITKNTKKAAASRQEFRTSI